MSPRGRALLIGVAALAAAVLGVLAWNWTREASQPVAREDAVHTVPAVHVGEGQCASCHAVESRGWQGSHHDLAMQEATGATVLGNFDDATFTKDGVRTRFFRRDGRYWINTDGPDGEPADYEVKYTFGVNPLQQYLLQFDRGRLQAFTIAWDTQRDRWFHLYPDESIDHEDALHWTKPSQNWNFMCAECHSTDLKKGYERETDTYRTSWKQIDVGCQACHGPASRHLARMQDASDARQSTDAAPDFPVDLAGASATPQIEMCARCHSRRAVLWQEYEHGKPFLDTHMPSLLEPSLYFADGQIDGEVYEYGSFLQSKMFQKGMRCSDCHDPHTLKTRAPGNALCTACHNATAPAARASIDVAGLQRKVYDSPAHHFHEAGQPGSQCVDCHAPQRTYMVVDPRHDHSFRIPRPDLSVKMSTPNACNLCHADKAPQWAAEAVAKWYGPDRRQETTYGELLWAGNTRQRGGESALIGLVNDSGQPAIARATALRWLEAYPGARAFEALQSSLTAADPMLRLAAVSGLGMVPPERRAPLTTPFLADGVRAIRAEATALTAEVPADALGESQLTQLAAGIREFEAIQLGNADQPSAWLNLGSLHASIGDFAAARADLRTAIDMDPSFVPAYVNLADLESRGGDDAAAIALLQSAPPGIARAAATQHALGLAFARAGQYDEAVKALGAAARSEPGNARYDYVYAVALHDTGRAQQATRILEKALQMHPRDTSILAALAAYAEEAGRTEEAAKYRLLLD